jgi:hypothetical protein
MNLHEREKTTTKEEADFLLKEIIISFKKYWLAYSIKNLYIQ